jgi:hypothetical protein
MAACCAGLDPSTRRAIEPLAVDRFSVASEDISPQRRHQPTHCGHGTLGLADHQLRDCWICVEPVGMTGCVEPQKRFGGRWSAIGRGRLCWAGDVDGRLWLPSEAQAIGPSAQRGPRVTAISQGPLQRSVSRGAGQLQRRRVSESSRASGGLVLEEESQVQTGPAARSRRWPTPPGG